MARTESSPPTSKRSPPRATIASDRFNALPVVALRDADTQRSRLAYLGAAVICIMGAAALPFVPGPTTLSWVCVASLAIGAAYCAWLSGSRWREGSYSDLEASTAAVFICLAVLASTAYIGLLSGVTVTLTLIVIAFAMGHETRSKVVLVVLTAGYAVLAGLSVMGLVPRVSPAALSSSPLPVVLGAAGVEVVLVVSYVFGKSARRSAATALEQVERARFEIAGRDALLEEARIDLERLVGGGHAGRLSGQTLGGYRLGEVLGRGGVGEVYRGVAPDSDNEVAVKVLHANLAADDSVAERLFREARISSSLDSRHIIEVLADGIGPDGSPYLVMELLRGTTLAELLRDKGALDLAETKKLALDVTAALTAAHGASVVHRDIKPGNLMLLQPPRSSWKVLDFGISKLLVGEGTLTQGGPIGTPGYMAPEQSMGLTVDARADIFSLGAVLYRAITGRPPFGGGGLVTTLWRAAEQQPLRPSALVAVPKDVDLVLALSMAKVREERFATAAELAEALVAACDGKLDAAVRQRGEWLVAQNPWAEEIVSPQRDETEDSTVEP